MISIELSYKTEKRLKQILLVQSNKDKFFRKIIDFQIDELKLGLYNIKKDLDEFEKKYLIDTKLFYKKFQAGEIDDKDDFMIWAGIYEMFLRDKQILEKLKW
ncbi:MAG: hypothetical protein B6I24_03270 [Bacteroidetes bacterium 4572_128]|nr:MAG: hypothetical protein B6I24_03270 [Bacteroidetes bacterium 4572_128]